MRDLETVGVVDPEGVHLPAASGTDAAPLVERRREVDEAACRSVARTRQPGHETLLVHAEHAAVERRDVAGEREGALERGAAWVARERRYLPYLVIELAIGITAQDSHVMLVPR